LVLYLLDHIKQLHIIISGNIKKGFHFKV
jgi:hypothetical protein